MFLRALAIVVLNSYIAIFSTTKTQKVPSHSGAKAMFFGSTAIMHSYFWLCTVAERQNIYIYIYICVHTTFLILYSFFCILFSSLCVSLLTASPFASFFLHKRIVDLHKPSYHRPITDDLCSAADPH